MVGNLQAPELRAMASPWATAWCNCNATLHGATVLVSLTTLPSISALSKIQQHTRAVFCLSCACFSLHIPGNVSAKHMAISTAQSNAELALSIVSSTAICDIQDLCNLLQVSQGLQAAIVSKEGNRQWMLEFLVNETNLAHTVEFSHWLANHSMLVRQLSVSRSDDSQVIDAHDYAILLGLRSPLQLTDLSINHWMPVKLLQQVDPQKLTALEVFWLDPRPHPIPPALSAQIGRFSKLKDLVLCLEWEPDAVAWSCCRSLTQLTSLEKLKIRYTYPAARWHHIPSQLVHLDCYDLDDEAVNNMSHLVQLKELVLDAPFVTGTALKAVGTCMSQLQELTIVWRNVEPAVCKDQLQALQVMTALQQLKLTGLPSLTVQDVASIAQASSVTSLKLNACSVVDKTLDLSGFLVLKHLQNLVVNIQ